jgi:tetratricopeptide (TPR) repeat protein
VEFYREVKPMSDQRQLEERWDNQQNPPFSGQASTSVRTATRRAPFLTALFLFLIIGFIVQMGLRRPQSLPSPVANKLSTYSETPFIRNIYELIAKNETSRALEELSKYHQMNPTDVDYLIPYSALLILENHNNQQARIHLDKVLTSNVGNSLKAKAHLWYGYSLLSEEEEDFGESHFLEALQLTPNDPATRFNLGRTYIKQNKFAHALDYLQLAEVEVPDLWLIHIYKGRAKVALGKLDEARASFRLAIESSPDRWISYVYYALFLLGTKDLNEARLTLQKMLTRDPSFEVYSPAPWGFYQEDIDYREYLTAYNNVMAHTKEEEQEIGKVFISFMMNGNGPLEHNKLQTMAEKGGLATRVLALSTLLLSTPKTDDLRHSLVRLGGNLSEFGPYAYVIRAEAKTRIGNMVEAQQDLNSALLSEPKSAAAHLLQYRIYRLLNKRDEAYRELQTILSYHPNYIPAITFLQEN